MSQAPPVPLIIPLEEGGDRAPVGGKAAGLYFLKQIGYRVPPTLCLTTAAYEMAVQAEGLNPHREWKRIVAADRDERARRLTSVRERVRRAGLPRVVAEGLKDTLPAFQAETRAVLGHDALHWAVRSSAVQEDSDRGSFSGLYHTTLGASTSELSTAIVTCWASLWTEAATSYATRVGPTRAPAMAVMIQPLLPSRAAGVAYSCHPVTGDPTMLVIDAVGGLGVGLVSGSMRPDQYVVTGQSVASRTIAEKPLRQVYSPLRGVLTEEVPSTTRGLSSLTDPEILQLAQIVRDVERAAGYPVDVEWALYDGVWLLQARPILRRKPPVPKPSETETERPPACVWSRANFIETLPELPSPLSLAFVRRFMETNIVDHYRSVGCHIPRGVSSVRVVDGRPYINVTLFQSLMAQLGGDPSTISDQMGGEGSPSVEGTTLPMSRLGSLQLVRAMWRLERQVWRAGRTGLHWFAELSQIADSQWTRSVEELSEEHLVQRMTEINAHLERGDLTFAIVSGVSQAMYALGALLTRRLTNPRSVLDAATQGLGTIISARQILWLQELADAANREPYVRRFFIEPPWQPAGFRTVLAGSRFLASFDTFLKEYGHRAVGESDVMSPRYAEVPESLLEIIRRYLMSELRDPAPASDSATTLVQRQAATRGAALREIRGALGARIHERLWFSLWYAVLRRFLSLRESNRHALMRYVAAARHLLQVLGKKLSTRGLLASAEDLFYLTDEELGVLVNDLSAPDPSIWAARIARRRQERQHQASLTVPYTLRDDETRAFKPSRAAEQRADQPLQGLSLSPGIVEGPVRLVLTPTDLQRTEPGDILVAPALDPGMAPAFGLAGGLIAEIGGLLSHGAIIAREYGIPAIANVPSATIRLQAGEWVRLDANRGEIWCGLPGPSQQTRGAGQSR